MRRSILVPLTSLVALAAACGYQPEIQQPGAATGASTPAPASAATGPISATPTFTPEGCPVDDPSFCEQAAFLANALVLSDSDAVFDLSRRVSLDCTQIARNRYPQCEDEDRLDGYVVGTHQGEFFVDPPADYRDILAFLVESIDEGYSDEFGGPQMQILGISTCGKGANTSHHVVYLVGLSDPESTLPGDRFLGTYELTRQGGEWAIGTAYVGLYTDWQLVLDDPLTQIACGDIRPWVGAAPNLNPPQSESQPTPIPGTGAT
ncbi:MAG: hypothetical protein WB297_07925 [Actinomycetota bacterium]